MIYNNTKLVLYLGIGVHQTPIPKIPIFFKIYLDSFIITVLKKSIFYAMIIRLGFTAGSKSESIYLMKFMKFCTHILDT